MMSLLFNTLSRFAMVLKEHIVFHLVRNKYKSKYNSEIQLEKVEKKNQAKSLIKVRILN